MPIATATSSDSIATYHDTTVTLVPNGSKVARRVRRQRASDVIYFNDHQPPFDHPYVANVYPPGATQSSNSGTLNQADAEFLQYERPTTSGYSPIVKNSPMQTGYLINANPPACLIANYGENPYRAGDGTIWMGDVHRLYVPSRWPDCAIDLDLPAPWGNVRLIYDNQAPILSARTAPGSWVRHAVRRGTGELFTDTAIIWGANRARNNGVQVNDHGDSLINNWWPFKTNYYGPSDIAFNPGSLPDLYLRMQGQSVPAYTFNPGTGISSPLRSNLKLQGQWFRADYKSFYPLGSGGYGDFVVSQGAALGGRFNIAFSDLSNPGTDLFAYIVANVAALTPPTITEPTQLFLCIWVGADSDDGTGTGSTSYQEYQIISSGVYGTGNYDPLIGYGEFLGTGYQAPSYYPWDVKLCSYGDDETDIRYVRHAGYIPSTAPTQASLTTVAPTLERSGRVIYFRGGCAEFDQATATEADFLIQAGTPAGGGFVRPNDFADAWLPSSYLRYVWNEPSLSLREPASSCLFRIWCPELGQEWAVGFGIQLDREWSFDGTDWNQDGAFRVTAMDVLFGSGVGFSCCGTLIAGHRYPGPAVELPPAADGKALVAEITVAQNLGVCGGYRKLIRRWNPAVP